MTMNTTYLITGANRGIGRGLAEIVLSRPNHTLLALVRNPSHSTSQSLLAIPRASNSDVILLPYDASIPTSASEAVKALESSHKITTVDTVIANAGALGEVGLSTALLPSAFSDLFQTNTIGPIMLFNATFPFLQNSNDPKFVVISSAIGSTALIPTRGGQALPYGISKAALNHAICKMDQCYQDIAFELLTPGLTKTDFMGPDIDWSKYPNAQSMDVVVPGLMQRIDEVRKAEKKKGLVFKDWKGDVIPW